MRFPEFSGEWKKYKLSEVCSFFSGGTPSSSKKEYYDGSIPFIRSGEIHENKTELFITEEGLNNSAAKKVIIGDLLLALYGATSGDIAISQINGAINQAILCIRTTQNKKFVESVWKKHVNKLLQTYLQGGQGNLSADIVKNISFYLTSNIEQNKLARFVSLLDERIATQNKIIEKLESLIKGIAHRVAGMGKPNVCLKECLECTSSALQESEVSDLGPYPVYGANGIVGFLDSYNTPDEAIYIVKDGSGVGSVAYVKGKCSATGTLHILTAKQEYSLQFLYYILKVFNFEPYKTGMAIPHIYFKDYGNTMIFCPPYADQLRYAQMLGAIDTKLLLEKNYLISLNSQKQYLLRLMFI